jgi:hypothetical protein
MESREKEGGVKCRITFRLLVWCWIITAINASVAYVANKFVRSLRSLRRSLYNLGHSSASCLHLLSCGGACEAKLLYL